MRNRSVKLLSGASVLAVVAGLQPAQGAAVTISGDPSHAAYTTGASDNTVTINLDSTIRADGVTGNSFYNAQTISGAPTFLTINDSALIGDISNAGSLTSTTGNAISILNDSQVFGRVTNAGLLDGNLVGISLTQDSTIAGGIVNSGTINGGSTAILIDTGSELLGGVSNSGVISGGAAGIAVKDGVAGELWGGIHNDAAGTISAQTTAAVLLSGLTYQGGITNAGHISGQGSADGIQMTAGTFDGDIVNSGVIESTAVTGNAIAITGGTFNGSISNTGQILADNTSGIAINITGGTFTGNISNSVDGANRGRISADFTAVNIANTSFTGDVNNSGDIASANGIGVSISTTTFTGNVNNLAGGAISANQTALLVTAATFSGSITNAGLISSSAADAVIIDSALFQNGDFVNTASGSIVGVTHALVFSGTAFNGNVTNDGSISASGDAVRIESGTTLTGAVTNNGAIASSTHDGVVVAGTLTGTLDNTADGTIQGAHNGITIAATGSVTGGITNSGTIIAATGAAIDLSAATVAHTINQTGGLLRGGSGATIATAVNMANVGVADRLNADGGVIDGDIVGGVAHTDDVIMTPDDKVVYLRGTASNIDQFDMAGAGTAILGADARGATGASAVGVTIGAASMTHSGSGTLYLDDNTHVTLTGAYAQTDGTLEFFLTPDVATHGYIHAATANLDGNVAAYIDSAAFAAAGGDTFTYANVITGTRTGNFNNAADIGINSLFFDGHVVTHAAAVDIVLDRLAFTDALVLPGLSQNEISVGDAIETIYGNGSYGTDFQNLFAYLFSLPAGSQAEAQHAYDELAGAEHATVQEIGLRLGHSFDNAVDGRLADLRGTSGSSSSMASLGLRRLAEADPIVASDAMPEGSPRLRGAQNVGIWAQAYGDWTDADSDIEAAGYDQQNKGVAGGADMAINNAIHAGAAIGASQANADFHTRGDSADIDAFNAAVYAAFETGHFYADAILSYGAQDVSSTRTIDLGFGTFAAAAGYNASSWSGNARTGYVADLGAVSVEPFAAIRYALLSTDSFQETGAGGYDLIVAGQDATSLTSSLGARISGAWTGGGIRYVPSLEMSWRHEYLDDRQTILAAFEEDPTTRFQIVSSSLAADSAVVRARFGAELNPGLMVYLDYNGLYNSTASTHGATAGIRASW